MVVLCVAEVLRLPVGGTHNYATTSWKVQAGGGRNFNKTFGVMLQFDYDKFGMQTSTLNKQLALYNALGAGSAAPAWRQRS